MKLTLKNIALIFISLILVNCAGNSVSMKRDSYKEGCDAEMKVLKSFGDTIRIEHSPAEYDKALNLSKVYCAERKKLSNKNQSNCDGCCRTTYICKGDLKTDKSTTKKKN